MKTHKLSVGLLLVSLTLLCLSSFAGARILDTAEIKVRIDVPVIQRMEVLEPVVVSFTYPWQGSEDGQPLIFRNVGSVQVQSNADWSLTVASLMDNGFNVYIRPADNPYGHWLPVNGFGSVFSGLQGANELSWDIKIEVPQHLNTEQLQETIQLAFTIGQA